MVIAQRWFVALLGWSLLVACGDGGGTAPPQPTTDRPQPNPERPSGNTQDPPPNGQDPLPNAQDPAPPNSGIAAAPGVDNTGGRGNAEGGGGNVAGNGNPGPGNGNSCTQAKGCVCDTECDTCKCAVGEGSTLCDAACN